MRSIDGSPVLYAALLSSAASVAVLGGCVGVFAELQATGYPSTKYTPVNDGNPTTATDAPKVGGLGFGVGFSVGVDWDTNRKSRFALGYTVQTAKLGGGGTTTGGYADMRYDFNLVNLDDYKKIRLGVGAGLGGGSSTLPSQAGGADFVESSKGNAIIYAGPVFTYYLAKKNHALHAMLGGQYFLGPVKEGRLSGWGVTAKVAYNYQFGDSRPDVFFYVPLEDNVNIMKIVHEAAIAEGCTAEYKFEGTYALVVAKSCPPQEIEITYDQTSEGLGILCRHASSSEGCRGTHVRIFERAKAILDARKHAKDAEAANATGNTASPAASTSASAAASTSAAPSPSAAPAPTP